MTRFERATVCLEGRSSTVELHPQGGRALLLPRLATCSFTGNKKPGGNNHPHHLLLRRSKKPEGSGTHPDQGAFSVVPRRGSWWLHQGRFRVYPRLMVSLSSSFLSVLKVMVSVPSAPEMTVSPPKSSTSSPIPPKGMLTGPAAAAPKVSTLVAFR